MFGSNDGTRERSRRLVLEQIMARRSVSRQEIVDTTGLSKAAVSEIVADLMANGLTQNRPQPERFLTAPSG